MQFILTVFGRRDINPYDTDEDMHAAFARVGQFNQMLQDEGHWVVAGGMASPDDAKTIGPDGWIVDGPYLNADTFPSGFWIIEAKDEDEAIDLTRQAAAACANHVELRAVAG
ncbi:MULTISPECIES: YciI family protein [unclassified Corynebacterium]|uniref:YciI family protein n=1 Tax=unclassified Corynebacterium TaxID=2624378 RepID=UPI0030A6DF57